MADKTNIPTGLNITSQIPLNYKEWVINEATLSYLGVNDNLAYTYHDNIEIFCFNEKTLYRWREVLPGEENTGLIPLDFTYPANIVTNGITYSNKKYNFFLIKYVTEQELLTLIDINNVGTGTQIYKEGTKYDFRTLESTTLNITSTENEINLEIPDNSSILQFIVNSDYTGTEELGTILKPFKNLQNALNAYVGTGTNLLPQNSGAIITIQKDTNIFTGNLAYYNLKLLLKQGVNLTSNPAFGDRLLDLDASAVLPTGMIPFTNTTPTDISITIEEGAGINLLKQGFKNAGTLLNTNNSLGKIIRLLGEGYISIANDTVTTSPSVRNIIEANASNTAGFFNDGNVANFDIRCSLLTNNTQIVKAGLNSKIYFTDSIAQFNDTNVTYNENTIPFELDSAINIAVNTNFVNYNKVGLLLNNNFTLKNTAIFNARNCNVGGTCEYLFENVGTGQPQLLLNNCFHEGIINSSIGKSTSVLWDNSTFINCYFYSGTIDDTQFKINANFINSLGAKILVTLQSFASKTAAISGGLVKGCLFRKRQTVNAVDLVAGEEYEIATSGSPSLGTVGTFIIATGSETGTGTAYLDKLEII